MKSPFQVHRLHHKLQLHCLDIFHQVIVSPTRPPTHYANHQIVSPQSRLASLAVLLHPHSRSLLPSGFQYPCYGAVSIFGSTTKFTFDLLPGQCKVMPIISHTTTTPIPPRIYQADLNEPQCSPHNWYNANHCLNN